LVHCVEGIFLKALAREWYVEVWRVDTYLHQLAAATVLVKVAYGRCHGAYLGENVVREKEYRSAMMGLGNV